ncbi:MAG: nucleoside triphosphate pyrophosphohydrolase [Porphyromonas sp.]|nr:nucleoside triphosphate pyrophosphohydrolase [Porphyromonas sp.]
MTTRQDKMEAFWRLLDVMDRLRAECPWDREQTNESLRANTIEEVHELSDAILSGASEEIKKELGDVLLHIVFYSKIGEEQGAYDVASVCHALCDKLIYRHPHIYGSAEADDSDSVVRNWEQLKQKEKGGNKTALSGVPSSLPSMIKAYRIQDKARGLGFDWEERREVWAKVREELAELEEALEAKDLDEAEAEWGDLFFGLINAARLYKINPDNALERTNQKFIRRFGYVEASAQAMGRELRDMTLAEMDTLWDEAKAKGL